VTGPRIVVAGVSGSGKSAVGAALAERLAVPVLDGDDLHPATSVAQIVAGAAHRVEGLVDHPGGGPSRSRGNGPG
jgi:adenylate kinase family enzyme